ncbi:uncharacterized protein LOC123316738 [Coccinella septempunctata]|uniref:uncharacterized protein LOC123316738 n=1 Tax=Coccinella septempunctata TaxID=41139 RepID=UPI001D063B53|nr:uncharacterized protein LOC123316738 [Coccinella septempunctata]
MEVIDQGLKHTLPNHSNRYPELLAVEVDAILEGTNLKTKEKDDIRTECRSLLYKEKRKTLQKRKNQEADTLKRLKEKIQRNDLTVVKADESSCTVIMTRTAYNNKVLEFIHDNGFKRLTTNPMTPLINKIKRYKVSEEFREVFGTYSKLVNPNPKIPKLYGLPYAC